MRASAVFACCAVLSIDYIIHTLRYWDLPASPTTLSTPNNRSSGQYQTPTIVSHVAFSKSRLRPQANNPPREHGSSGTLFLHYQFTHPLEMPLSDWPGQLVASRVRAPEFREKRNKPPVIYSIGSREPESDVLVSRVQRCCSGGQGYRLASSSARVVRDGEEASKTNILTKRN